jgi:DNA-directed RNA polymerase subunit M/transcription elongation factor TFIIS
MDERRTGIDRRSEDRGTPDRRKGGPKVPCPKCGDWQSLVTESRSRPTDEAYVRRRTCQSCGFKYRTAERVA